MTPEARWPSPLALYDSAEQARRLVVVRTLGPEAEDDPARLQAGSAAHSPGRRSQPRRQVVMETLGGRPLSSIRPYRAISCGARHARCSALPSPDGDPDGGGDTPESALDALGLAAAQPFRADATKVILLITDAPPRLPDKATATVARAAEAKPQAVGAV